MPNNATAPQQKNSTNGDGMALKVTLALIGVIAVSGIVYLLIILVPDGWAKGLPWSDSELISVFLTSVTIVLTVLAVILGLGAIFGYRELKSSIAIQVENKVQEELSQQLPQFARDQFKEFVQREAIIGFMGNSDDD